MSNKKELSIQQWIVGSLLMAGLFYLIGGWTGVVVVIIWVGIIIVIAFVRDSVTKREQVQFNPLNLDLSKPRRESIPPRVRMYVWQRDQGRCVECGSKENLHYDHIIPWSKGGSNTERNIQLLCESCNLSKSDKIGG